MRIVEANTSPADLAAEAIQNKTPYANRRYQMEVADQGQNAHGRSIAHDQESGERVFLKWSKNASEIKQEAEILAALNHQGIVHLRAQELTTKGGLLVLDLVDGVDMESWLGSGQVDDRQIEQTFIHLTEALAAIHAAGFIHRDLKPANIMIRPDGRPVILDFSAASRQGVLPSSSSYLTDGYAAPEQYLEDLAEGTWTDVYGLSALGYRVLSGRPPPPAPVREKGRSLVPVVGDNLPANLLTAVKQGLHLDPNERPQTVDAWRDLFMARVDQMFSGQSTASSAIDNYPPTIKVERRKSGNDLARRRSARSSPASNSRSTPAWIFRGGLALLALGAAVSAWFGLPLYERYVKTEWAVDPAGGGDRETIAEALLQARAGATITIQPGDYRESLTIERPVTLVAADLEQRPVIIASEGPCLMTGGTGSSITGLRFVQESPGAEGQACLQITGGDLKINQSEIETGSGVALRIGGGAKALVADSVITARAASVIVIGGEAQPNLRENRIIGGDGLSLFVRGGAVPTIERNTFEGGEGVLYAEAAGGFLTANQITGSRGSALRLTVGANPAITDNIVDRSGQVGLYIYDGGKGRFTNNRITGSRLTGVVVGSGGEATLAGNEISGSGEHGILVLDRGKARLEGNTVTGNVGHGLAVAWDGEVEVGSNVVSGNQLGDLYDARRPPSPLISKPVPGLSSRLTPPPPGGSGVFSPSPLGASSALSPPPPGGGSPLSPSPPGGSSTLPLPPLGGSGTLSPPPPGGSSTLSPPPPGGGGGSTTERLP